MRAWNLGRKVAAFYVAVTAVMTVGGQVLGPDSVWWIASVVLILPGYWIVGPLLFVLFGPLSMVGPVGSWMGPPLLVAAYTTIAAVQALVVVMVLEDLSQMLRSSRWCRMRSRASDGA